MLVLAVRGCITSDALPHSIAYLSHWKWHAVYLRANSFGSPCDCRVLTFALYYLMQKLVLFLFFYWKKGNIVLVSFIATKLAVQWFVNCFCFYHDILQIWKHVWLRYERPLTLWWTHLPKLKERNSSVRFLCAFLVCYTVLW